MTLQQAQECAEETQANVRYLIDAKQTVLRQLLEAEEDCRLAYATLSTIELRQSRNAPRSVAEADPRECFAELEDEGWKRE